MGPKLAVGSGAVLVLGLDPFPRTALSGSRPHGYSFGYHAERSLLNECVREAFWSRVLPLSGCLALAFRQAARWGIIASHPTLGVPLRFWALGALLGFEGGCAMYGDSCANKVVVRLPESRLAENILRYRNQLPAAKYKVTSGDSLMGASSGLLANSTHSEEKLTGVWDWQNFIPRSEEAVAEDFDTVQGPSKFTYAELRQRNRGTTREEVATSRPMSLYDKLRKQNREEANLAEKQLCKRNEN